MYAYTCSHFTKLSSLKEISKTHVKVKKILKIGSMTEKIDIRSGSQPSCDEGLRNRERWS